jgi:SAM-dependent methyltransferase
VTLFNRVHDGYVHRRRTDVLATRLSQLLPRDAEVVDIGTGDGLIAKKVLDLRPDLRLKATEVLVRPDQHVPVEPFDGRTLPFADDAFDAAMLVDVLHHTDDVVGLLGEAKRVSRGLIVLKDVMAEGALSRETLHLMERLANTAHGISIPDTFWRKDEWDDAFARLGLTVESWNGRLGLYPFPASLVFERRFHFIALLRG